MTIKQLNEKINELNQELSIQRLNHDLALKNKDKEISILKSQRLILLQNQVRLLTTLINDGRSLLIYRKQLVEITKIDIKKLLATDYKLGV